MIKDGLDIYHKKTRIAFLLTWILRTPFWAIYNMLPFILYKDLNATPIQIAAAVALKPTVSILSMYWSASVNKRKDRLVSNIIWGTALGLLPFFFFPFVNLTWYFIFSFGFFMMMHRGMVPAWMEIMKLNLPKTAREKTFAYGSTFSHLGDAILPFLFSWLLLDSDSYFQAWRWIFPVAASISLISLYFQSRIPIKTDNITTLPCANKITLPWKNAWNLVLQRADFRTFQIGFMLGGSALMLMHAILPAFYMGVLQLSYTELAIALTLCKGIGFAMTSQVWAKMINKIDIYRFSGLVTLFAFLFPLGLIAAKYNISALYIAYIFYGIMQAGSELCWNMSGPIFSKEEDSSLFSSVNVVAVGLRGLIAPGCGTLLGFWFGPFYAIAFGGVMCLFATLWMFSASFFMKKQSLILSKKTI